MAWAYVHAPLISWFGEFIPKASIYVIHAVQFVCVSVFSWIDVAFFFSCLCLNFIHFGIRFEIYKIVRVRKIRVKLYQGKKLIHTIRARFGGLTKTEETKKKEQNKTKNGPFKTVNNVAERSYCDRCQITCALETSSSFDQFIELFSTTRQQKHFFHNGNLQVNFKFPTKKPTFVRKIQKLIFQQTIKLLNRFATLCAVLCICEYLLCFCVIFLINASVTILDRPIF